MSRPWQTVALSSACCHAPAVTARPPPLTTRPLMPADAHAVFLLMAAAETAVLGEAEVGEADVVAD